MSRITFLSSLLVCLLTSCSSLVAPPDSSGTATRDGGLSLLASQRALLRQAVDEQSLVDYQELATSPKTLQEAYAAIARRSPDSHPEDFRSEDEKFAYWLNAYNVATIYGVVRSYPITSVRDVRPPSLLSFFPGGGFFAAQKFLFGGEAYSLYELENKVIRQRFDDPRLHFALNCASIGCPDLAREPFQASQLDAQLEKQTRIFLNSPKGFAIDHARKEISISAIFDWYREDFETDSTDLLDYVGRYLANPQPLRSARESGYKLVFSDYDWGLNEQR